LVLASLAALAPFAIDTYLPAFPTLEATLHGTTVGIQQSLTFYLFPYTVMTLWHGAISDSIGRIATIKWGFGVFILASIGCAFAPNVETLWFFRALQGMSGGAGNVVARALVRDLFEGAQAQRVMATVQMLFGIAPAVAPSSVECFWASIGRQFLSSWRFTQRLACGRLSGICRKPCRLQNVCRSRRSKY
jgi:DHA1 family bicyclomycin/chloramphenicol resistance-like MFS transporter